MESTKMNEALQILRAIFNIFVAVKMRSNHSDIDEPRKRIKLEPFQDNGAKAVKMPENHLVLLVN